MQQSTGEQGFGRRWELLESCSAVKPRPCRPFERHMRDAKTAIFRLPNFKIVSVADQRVQKSRQERQSSGNGNELCRR